MNEITPRYMNYKQAGEYMGVSDEAVRAYCRSKYFPVSKKNGKRWIDKEDIDRFMNRNKKG
jgi:predicted site-specific integrase-resolvase